MLYGLLLSDKINSLYSAQIDAIASKIDVPIKRLRLSQLTNAPPDLRGAFFSRDLYEGSTLNQPGELSNQFFALVDQAPKLSWLHVCTAGTDLPQYAPTKSREIALTSSKGVTALPIAQSVLAAVLAHARGFPHWLQAQRERRWEPLSLASAPKPIAGQKVLLIGAGAIGSEIAKLLSLVGFEVTALRKNPKKGGVYLDQVFSITELDRLLPLADWLVLAAPLTSETHGLINRSRIFKMPKGARVVNISRGSLIDEQALISALEEGHIGGAYLDTFTVEPLPETSKLWWLPNVWISPHNCAASQGHEEKVVQLFLKQLEKQLLYFKEVNRE